MQIESLVLAGFILFVLIFTILVIVGSGEWWYFAPLSLVLSC
jgi:hypothetical protein